MAPALLPDPPAAVALAVAGQRGPVRFGADADVILVLDGPDVRVVQPKEPLPVETGYLFPFADVDLGGGDVLAGRGPDLARRWRLAIAAELAGLLAPALELTVVLPAASASSSASRSVRSRPSSTASPRPTCG